MRYLLDTNICIYLIKNRPVIVREHFERHDFAKIGISSIVAAELYFGAAKSVSPRTRQVLDEFLATITILPFDHAASIHFGDLRAHLERRGTPIGSYDLQIAAHALALDCTLVTNNLREFERVPGLKLENWID